jgi:hypothetical protein
MKPRLLLCAYLDGRSEVRIQTPPPASLNISAMT